MRPDNLPLITFHYYLSFIRTILTKKKMAVAENGSPLFANEPMKNLVISIIETAY